MIDEGFNQIETDVKNDLLEKLKTIDPYYFEKVVLKLLHKMGYGDFIETSKSLLQIENENDLRKGFFFIFCKSYAFLVSFDQIEATN